MDSKSPELSCSRESTGQMVQHMNNLSFTLHIWVEPGELEGAAGAEWRGVIANVQSGERRYVNDLSEIRYFVATYLQKMGVKFTRMGQALESLKLCKRAVFRKG